MINKILKKGIISTVIFCIINIGFIGNVDAKSLYLIPNHHTDDFDAYDINPSGIAFYQATYDLTYATDPAGITMDESSNTLFVSSEFSGGVEMVNATTMSSEGVSSGPSNLAGLAVDDANNIVYAMLRWSDTLYAFDWDENAKTLTLKSGYPVNLPNCSGGFGIAIDEMKGLLWVADAVSPGVARAYNINTWIENENFSFQPIHQPIDIIVDRYREIVYTVSMKYAASTPFGTGSNYLSKYDLKTGIETTVNLGCQGVGVAVDEATGYVYVTVSPYCSYSSQGKLQAWDTSTIPWTQIQNFTTSGSPAGICIPRSQVSFNPLNLAKNDVVQGFGVHIGETFMYNISFSNNNNFNVTNVTIIDVLPDELDFISETINIPGVVGFYDVINHTVTWELDSLGINQSGYIKLQVKVNQLAMPNSTINNYCNISCIELPTTTVIGVDPDDPQNGTGTVILPELPGEDVYIDIKPGSCPNPINLGSKGVIPVAICTSADDFFDAMTIDPSTILLTREGYEDVGVSPIRWSYEDAATPYTGDEECGCHELKGDGYIDLSLKFNSQDVINTLNLSEETGNTIPLIITGNLKEEFDGSLIKGQDCVWILANKPMPLLEHFPLLRSLLSYLQTFL